MDTGGYGIDFLAAVAAVKKRESQRGGRERGPAPTQIGCIEKKSLLLAAELFRRG
jgi:hypothetical protein